MLTIDGAGIGPGPFTTCKFLRQTRFSALTSALTLVSVVVIGSSPDETTARRQLCVAAVIGTVQSHETITGRLGSSTGIFWAAPIGVQLAVLVKLKAGGTSAFGRLGNPADASAKKARTLTLVVGCQPRLCTCK